MMTVTRPYATCLTTDNSTGCSSVCPCGFQGITVLSGVCLCSVGGQLQSGGPILMVPFQDCPLKEGEVAWVYCYPMVVIRPPLLNQLPLLLLLQHTQSCAWQQLAATMQLSAA